MRICLLLAALNAAWLTLPRSVSASLEVYEAPPLPAPLELLETPSLEAAVAAGRLPPVLERMPKSPRVVPVSSERGLGRPGGELRTLVGKAKDTRLLVVYGYARLIGYDEDLNLVPDILERVEVEDGRRFTFKLRQGHRWSDGRPFTAEDFRFYWEEVANNEEISPTGPPKALLVDGEAPKVEFPDETTVRYTWTKSNPFLLTALAKARPLFLYQPAHYLKQFHANHADPDELAALVEAARASSWAALYNRKARQYRDNNPELPTLQPWINTTAPPSQRFVAVRNPYYHRLDPAGRQLPYIDTVILQVAGGSLIPAKTGAGETDLQARGLHFSDYPFLKSNAKRNNYDVRLWRTVRGSQVALYPNLNVNDPVWREVVRDARFRRAISLAVDRQEINQAIYFGLGLVGNQSVLPDSALYEPNYRSAYAQFDPEAANKLLDDLGLSARDDRGIRLLPDGRPMDIVVETAGENTEEVDVLELIHDSWLKVGIKLFSKPSQREVLRNRIFAGETLASMWFGYENAVPTAQMSPGEFAPTSQHSLHWPKWGQYFETSGRAGEPVDMHWPKELLGLYHAWRNAESRTEKEKIWHRILEIHADQVYTIGLVAQVPQPVVVSNKLRNVPKEGIFNWDPGAQFGIYRPDSFWLAD
ncbi:MAG: ABC transporter substrate-binding protein [Rhodospirillales bacterium]|nr:ABC transporter substrate-binding protein [Rhodospirillales bacterium]